MSDSENDLFGDENTSPAPEHAPSPGGSPGGSPPRRRADPDEEDDNANELVS
jgi:hypothetical protein